MDTLPAACSGAPTISEGKAPEGADMSDRVGQTLRRARTYHGWSLREVERRTGRPNAYLSQVERGVIKKPDPAFLWQLADLYGLNFELLIEWIDPTNGGTGREDPVDDPTTQTLIRQVLGLSPSQRVKALAYFDSLTHEDRR